jgi:hypothetical protein
VNSDLENSELESDVGSLMKKMRKLEPVLMCSEQRSFKFHCNKQKLQRPQLDLVKAVKLFKSLKTCIRYKN